MEGQTFFAYNVETMHEEHVWSYRDLQRLCVTLGLGGRGKRAKLVKKLADWHRSRYEDDSCLLPVKSKEEENIPMNVIGNNFGILPVTITSTRRDSRKRKSLVGIGDEPAVVSPDMLRPLEKRPPKGSPRSILKKSRTSCSEHHSTPPMMHEREAPRKLDKITFSPYNAVQVIAHRTDNSDNPEGWRWVDPADSFEDSESEEEEEEEDDDVEDGEEVEGEEDSVSEGDDSDMNDEMDEENSSESDTEDECTMEN